MKSIEKYFLIIFLCFYSAANSQIETGEEDSFEEVIQEFAFSSSVYLQDKNEIQNTLFGVHSKNETTMNALGYEIEYGVTDWIQFSAAYAYQHTKMEDISYHNANLELGTLISIFNNSRQAAAFSMEAEIPLNTPDREIPETEFNTSYNPTLIYARQFEKIQLHLNVGAELSEEAPEWFYNAAAVYGRGNIHPIIEINAVNEEEFKWYPGAGIVFNNDKGWELGAGARHGINNSQLGRRSKSYL